jgi:hypothetical protein
MKGFESLAQFYSSAAVMVAGWFERTLSNMSGMPVRYVMDCTDFRVKNSSFGAISAFFTAFFLLQQGIFCFYSTEI